MNQTKKIFIKSPSFRDINADLQFYRDNEIIKLDLKVTKIQYYYIKLNYITSQTKQDIKIIQITSPQNYIFIQLFLQVQTPHNM